MSDYAGSQAFANTSHGSESVNRNTGSLTFTKTLIKLIGIKKSIDLCLSLRYGDGMQGSFGLPSNWTFDIPFLEPYKSLTKDGRTYIIDPTWADELGYRSGLRYINNHGIKLTAEGSNQPLPSGLPGYYQWKYQQSDGRSLYFDGTGKLLEVDDLHGNHLYYSYVNSGARPATARLSTIQDSWGQTVRFGYQGQSEIIIESPDTSSTTLQFNNAGVAEIRDGMGYVTSFVHTSFGTRSVLDTITYPYGLVARFTYQSIAYLDAQKQTGHFPAIRDHYHLQQTSIISRTSYSFGSQSGSATYTGFSAGYQLASTQDTLMESNNLLYLYDVLVANYDPKDQLLSASRIFYNFLHLPTREVHYTLPDGQIIPSYQTFYQYVLGENLHARSTNYSLPSVTEQYNLDSSGNRQLLRRSNMTYDSFGCPLSSTDQICQADGSIVELRSYVTTYVQASWGGEMPLTELFQDKVTNQQRLLTYSLTSDDKNVEQILTEYKNADGDTWLPWKRKDLSWDKQGRLTSETVSFSRGISPPDGTPSSYNHTLSYLFDQSKGHIISSTADSAGNTRATTHSTLIMHGPVVQKTLPLGQAESLEYDQLGRLTKYTDPMGNATTTEYTIGQSGSTVTTITSTSYTTTRTYSVRGELLEISDNGAPTTRVLRKAEFDALSRPAVKTNELGLSTSFAYDALNRLTQTSDYLNNVTTVTHDDVLLTQTSYVNGQLRITTQKDAFGRVISTTQHADTSDKTIDYSLVHKTAYSGFSLAIKTTTQQMALSDGSLIVLLTSEKTYDPEFAVISETSQSVRSDLKTIDLLERHYQYDIFGHIFNYSKKVTYAEGMSHDWIAPKSFYDACGRLVKVENQLEGAETFAYDANDFLISMTRYSGDTVRYERDEIGRAIKTVGPSGTMLKSYMQNGRLAKVEATGSSSGSVVYSYTLDGSLVNVSYADGPGQSYTLDNYARVTTSKDAFGSEQSTTYDQRGQISSRSMGNETVKYEYQTINHVNNRLAGDSSTSKSRELFYDGFDRVSGTTTRQTDGQIMLENGYIYNSQGKLVKTEVSSAVYPNQDNLNYIRSYEYDGLGQLRTDATQFKSGKSRRILYTYDGNHNIIAINTDGVTEVRTYNAMDQRADKGFSWDVDGRLLCDNEGRSYTYSLDDTVLSVSGPSGVVRFRYGPNGALASKESKTNRELFYYDMGSVNATSSTTNSNTINTSYLQEPGRRIAGLTKDIKRQDFLQSEGSTSLMIEGTDAAVTDYAAYGSASGASPLFGYKQELTDSTSGLIYLRSRYYQPSCGTFLTSDIESNENRYAYCNGDPTNLVDRDGRSATTGDIVGAVFGTLVTVAVGLASGGIGAAIFGPECVGASIAAGSLAGATGNISGDATSAAIQGRHFSAEEGIEDVVAGGVGGAVGTGAGGFAGSRAMSAALAEGMSQRAITITGSVTSGIVGGASGGFSSSAAMAEMTGHPVFSEETAISTVTGVIGGLGGGVLHSGAYLGLVSSKIIPVPLSASELSFITRAVEPPGAGLEKSLYVMAPQDEAIKTFNNFNTRKLRPNDALRLRPGIRPTENAYDTIAAHGLGGSVFASVRYSGGEFVEGGVRVEPNYVRPVKGKLFAQHMAGIEGWREGGAVKFLCCFGAWSNAQAMATALDRDVYASYALCNRYSANTNWTTFKSGSAHLHQD